MMACLHERADAHHEEQPVERVHGLRNGGRGGSGACPISTG
jgi:hypothetical protein